MFSNIQANSFNTKLMRVDFSNFAMTKCVLQNKTINRVEKYTLIFSQNIMMSTIKNRGMETYIFEFIIKGVRMENMDWIARRLVELA